MLSLSFTLQAPADFNTRLVYKLSEMTNSPVPTKIEIEVVSQDKLQKMYRNDIFNSCIVVTRGNFDGCAFQAQSRNVFIYGKWVDERNPKYLHIVLYEKAGVDTLVHEYLHYWLNSQTVREGMLNTEQIVDLMTVQITTSPEFIRWLGGEK
jgi:hypothetical protein